MDMFLNRRHAGKILAESLRGFAKQPDVIVLGLPRGGVPVAYEIADTLEVPLDVFVVRKLGVPGHVELAMGAIASGDTLVLNDDIVQSLNISKSTIDKVKASEKQELIRREKLYRGNRAPIDFNNKKIILADDGIATGATMRVAIKALRLLNPKEIIIAVPVAAPDTAISLGALADKFICLQTPAEFYAVAPFYYDFSQTEDEEVFALLSHQFRNTQKNS